MRSTILRVQSTAIGVVLIGVFLRVPPAGGVHLVSSQPISATDKPNNAPVQFAPKLASKLGLSTPQNHEVPEVSHSDEAIAAAVHQLMESHRRQSAYLERLAALAPKPRREDSHSAKKHAPKKAVKTKTTSPSAMPAPETAHVMRPGNPRPQPVLQTEKVHSSDDKQSHTESATSPTVPANETSDKVSAYPNNSVPYKIPFHSHPCAHSPKLGQQPYPPHNFIQYVNPNPHLTLLQHFPEPYPRTSEDATRFPSSNFIGSEGSISFNPVNVLPRAHPSLNRGYPVSHYSADSAPINVISSPFYHERRPYFASSPSLTDVNP